MSELAASLALAAFALAGAAAAQPGLGDPTRPTPLVAPAEERVATLAGPAPRWRLQSTLIADERRVAVINGRSVAQGTRVEGALLREVRNDGVTLEVDGRSVQLRLQGASDFKRAGP